jgi:hypothetical protein
MHQRLPHITVTQADTSDAIGLVPVEVRAAEFPMDVKEIADAIRQSGNHAIRITVEYKKVGWCQYRIVENDIAIDRLSVVEGDYLFDALTKLFETLSFTPGDSRKPRFTIVWPEFGSDNFMFNILLDAFDFKIDKVLKDEFFAYGANYDGYKLVRNV